MTGWIQADGGDSLLTLWVVPGASRSEVDGEHGDALKLRVAAPPERGRANRAVVDLLRDRLGAEVWLVEGEASRRKRVRVRGLTPAEVSERLSIRI